MLKMRNLIWSAILYLVVLTASAQSKEIHILSVNDIHAAIDRFPKFIALVDSMRTIYPDLLLFSVGDNRTGNPANDMHHDSYPVVELMNKAGFNLSAIGNHEFDGKVEGLRSMLNGSHFRYVCANMYAPDSMRLHIEPYKIFEIGDVRIAVLGLLQQGMNGLPDTHPDNVRNIAFRPFAQVADQYSWLRNQCDLFILLVHEEYDACVEFLYQYPYADVLIGSHTHKRIEATEIHNGVLITQAESSLKYVTHITIELADGEVIKKEARLLDVNAFSTIDPDVQAMVDAYNNNEALLRELTQVITDFDSYEELGYLMSDAIRLETGADIAFQNPGGVRLETFPKGAMSVRDVYRLDPFNNEVIEFQLTGEEVQRLIEAAYIAENKQPPYVSGITYEMDVDRQGQVKNLQVKMADGSRINLQRSYNVVMNSYLAAISQYEKKDPGKSVFRTSAELTIDYLEKQPALDYNGIKRVKINK
jgi:5'-nucleotidase